MSAYKDLYTIDDLPAPENGVIQAGAYVYRVFGTITLPDDVTIRAPYGVAFEGVHGAQSKIVGNSDTVPVITFDDDHGTDDGWFRSEWMELRQNGAAPVIDFTGAGARAWFRIKNSRLYAAGGGPLGNIAAATTIMARSTFIGFSTGWTYTGSNRFWNQSEVFYQQGDGGAGNAIFDLGVATFNSFRVDRSTFIAEGANGFLITGLADSGNIAAGGIGEFLGTRYAGTALPMDTIQSEDTLWSVRGCVNIKDSITYGRATMTGNSTANTFGGGAGVYERIAGTSVLRVTPRFDDGAGSTNHTLRLTFTPRSPVEIRAAITFFKAGTQRQCTMAICRNGTPILEQSFVAWADDIAFTAAQALVEDPTEGDEFDVFVRPDGHAEATTIVESRLTAYGLP